MKKATFALSTALILATACTSPQQKSTAIESDTTAKKETVIAVHYGKKIEKKVPKKEQELFIEKCNNFCERNRIPDVNWLFWVFNFEGDFETGKLNYAGSGATGLIQFMPATAEELGTTTEKLAKMSHLQQFEFVEDYLERRIKRYGTPYSITHLYLMILCPRGCDPLKKGEFDYVLWKKGTKAFNQNKGILAVIGKKTDLDNIRVGDVSTMVHMTFKKQTK